MKRILLFDLGDTLIRYYHSPEFPPLLKECVRRTTVSLQQSRFLVPSEAEIAHRVHAENYEARNFRVRPLEQRLGRIFGLKRSAGQTHLVTDMCRVFMKPIFAIASLYPDTLPALTALRDRGFRLGVVSNTPWGCPAVLWREELARHGVLSLCEHVLFCRDVGWRKPARLIFQKAFEIFGCSPDDCVFVGDSVKWDVDGAQKVGMTPVLIDRSGHTRERNIQKITSLVELDALLGSL